MSTDRFNDKELWNLPSEAHCDCEGPFDPEDSWLTRACAEEQRMAMQEWFLARYCDPAIDTPRGRYGGFIFIHGGPYDPGVEIARRFSGLLDAELIHAVVIELTFSGGDQWAPVRFDEDSNEAERDCA